MRELKGLLPALVILLIIGITAAVAPLVAREVAFAIEKGRLEAVRSELDQFQDEKGREELRRRLVVRSVSPAVVEIRIRRESSSDTFSGLGSGVVVDAEKGLVLTNNHVIAGAGAEEIEVYLKDRRKLVAQWVETDPQTDLAVVKIKPARLIAAPWGDSDEMEVPDEVLAIGAPDGLAQSVTRGVISAKGRTGVGDTADFRDFLQTDAAINKGNSGGPLVNLRGEVIGINTAIHSRSGGNEGIGFAIPANMARQIYRQLAARQKVSRGFIGVGMKNVEDETARLLQLPHRRGVQVIRIAKGGPADRAGLKIDDFIVEINGRPVRNYFDVQAVIAQIPPGQKARLVFYRNARKDSVEMTIGRRPERIDTAFAPTDGPGMETETLSPSLAAAWGFGLDQRGALVTGVRSESAAHRAGLRTGMLITHAQGGKIDSASDLNVLLPRAAGSRGLRLRVVTAEGLSEQIVLRY
jgi:serine protease Do